MFKMIPHCAKGSWIVSQSVGTTPVILGKKLRTAYYTTPRCVRTLRHATQAGRGDVRGRPAPLFLFSSRGTVRRASGDSSRGLTQCVEGSCCQAEAPADPAWPPGAACRRQVARARLRLTTAAADREAQVHRG